ncbi:MAG: plasmid mobilization relaxosome protein MobC [Defluviitaleaceae bacterium]|nr:plasmid mobilization relaxosome protein MobC [Defluviitaleaceae bacterium]
MSNSKPNRKRDVQFHFCANKEEADLIRQRMAATGIVSLGAFFRKMAIDGYHVYLDLSDVREMVRLLSSATNSMNQIAKRANATDNIYAADLEDLRQQYHSLWDAARGILDGLAKIK